MKNGVLLKEYDNLKATVTPSDDEEFLESSQIQLKVIWKSGVIFGRIKVLYWLFGRYHVSRGV